MNYIITVITTLTIGVVSAQTSIVSVTSPLTGTVFTAGQDATISWIDPKIDTIAKIVLAKGSPFALQPVITVAENVDAKTGSYIWKIPPDTAAGNDYALELGVSPDMSFAGLFTIKNDGNIYSTSFAVSSAYLSSILLSSHDPTHVIASSSANHQQETQSQASVATVSNATESHTTETHAVASNAVTQEVSSSGLKLLSNNVFIGIAALIGTITIALA